jgi:hypothetical protein
MKPWRQGAKTTAEEIHNTLDPAACENIQRRFLGALLEGYRDYVLHIHTSPYTSRSSQEWSPARGEAWALGQEMAQDDFARVKQASSNPHETKCVVAGSATDPGESTGTPDLGSAI